MKRPLYVEAAARNDLKALAEFGDSALARAYLAMARELDEGVPPRDAAALVAQMRLTLMTLREIGGAGEEDDFTDELRARREARMQGSQSSTRSRK